MSDTRVTSISELKEYSSGSIVKLPDFSEGQPFYARLRRPSLMNMARKGMIPNDLLVTANELFTNKAVNVVNVQDEKFMERMFGVMDTMCEAVFVEPTYKELVDAGIELTDEQYMFVFTYTQQGVNALKPFHTDKPN